MDILIASCGGALISALSALLMWFLNRRAAVKDNNKNKTDEVMEKLNRIESKLDSHIAENEEEKANNSRLQILRFGDEVKNGVRHSEESWNEVLANISAYRTYADTHPTYLNAKADGIIGFLNQLYQERLDKNDFL